ncbi:urease accessory protein UreD [Staphylococcus debuckii]|nr:urease accessory protein UreD [Staphylococcus debuckii]AYU55913.1 urease accessory protein UreD [Staphylococcus debuckii]
MSKEPEWTGQLNLSIFHDGERSVARDIFFEKALKVIRPIYLNGSDIPTFYIVNVGGGYLDGDRYKLNVRVQENAAVTLTSQGATKIYKTLKDHVEQYQNFHIEDNAYLEYVGDPIIAYKDANFYQHNQFHLAQTAAMFYTDILTPGYSPDERHFTYDSLHLLNEIFVDDELVVFDNMLLDPSKNKVDALGYMEGYTHLVSCYFIHPDITKQTIDELYEIMKSFLTDNQCRIGITELATHGLAIRILAQQTDLIEAILKEVQIKVVQQFYNREVNFLRKY